jgi:hypothetical protein
VQASPNDVPPPAVHQSWLFDQAVLLKKNRIFHLLPICDGRQFSLFAAAKTVEINTSGEHITNYCKQLI